LLYWWTIQSIGFCIVLFTLIVQLATNPMLVRKLNIVLKFLMHDV
jgi:CPA1 family monovalent cation:H+ antiporter